VPFRSVKSEVVPFRRNNAKAWNDQRARESMWKIVDALVDRGPPARAVALSWTQLSRKTKLSPRILTKWLLWFKEESGLERFYDARARRFLYKCTDLKGIALPYHFTVWGRAQVALPFKNPRHHEGSIQPIARDRGRLWTGSTGMLKLRRDGTRVSAKK